MPYAVIMAGGKGERFWPKSRTNVPKQLLSLGGNETLLQNSVKRLKHSFNPKDIFCVINDRYVEEVKKQVPSLSNKNIISEPESKNTAACIALAAFLLQKKKKKDEIMVVLPADQYISDNKKFNKIISTAVKLASKNNTIVTIGVKPAYPATQYGYLKISKQNGSKDLKVEKFIEKPDLKKAKHFLKEKKYLWNSGIFVFKISVILKAIKKHMPQLYKKMEKITACAGTKKYKKVLKQEYLKLRKISIDYGIMERVDNLCAVKADFDWEDTGNWTSLEKIVCADNNGNVVLGKFRGVEAKNNLIAADEGHLVTVIGASDLLIVHTSDATLICNKNSVDKIRSLVKKLSSDKKYKKYVS